MTRLIPQSSRSSTMAQGRRSRATTQLDSVETNAGWTAHEAAPERVGLYRRLTMGAAQRGWRLAPKEVEILLDVYVAYVRRDEEPTAERCLRVLKRFRRGQGRDGR